MEGISDIIWHHYGRYSRINTGQSELCHDFQCVPLCPLSLPMRPWKLTFIKSWEWSQGGIGVVVLVPCATTKYEDCLLEYLLPLQSFCLYYGDLSSLKYLRSHSLRFPLTTICYGELSLGKDLTDHRVTWAMTIMVEFQELKQASRYEVCELQKFLHRWSPIHASTLKVGADCRSKTNVGSQRCLVRICLWKGTRCTFFDA